DHAHALAVPVARDLEAEDVAVVLGRPHEVRHGELRDDGLEADRCSRVRAHGRSPRASLLSSLRERAHQNADDRVDDDAMCGTSEPADRTNDDRFACGEQLGRPNEAVSRQPTFSERTCTESDRRGITVRIAGDLAEGPILTSRTGYGEGWPQLRR